VNDSETAKDCLQDSLVHLLKNIGKYKQTGSFKSWAARVTTTQCLQYLRREKKHINFHIEDSLEPSQEETVSTKMEVDEVLQFLQTLPDNYRIAVNMYIVEGYNHKEIGERLGITESSSRSLVSRARKMILEAFVENNDAGRTIKPIKKLKKLA